MKKILATIIGILCIVSFANGQERGDTYINGIIGVSTSSSTAKYDGSDSQKVPSESVYIIGVGYAFFPADHFRIGLDASLEIQSIPNGERTFKHKPVTTTIGPSFAYYVPITSTFYYTPQLDVAAVFGAYSLESSLEKQTINYSGVAFGISPVKFEFRPTDHFGLDVDIMSLTYAHMNYKLKDSVTTSNTLGFKLCINPSVGFKYYF